jgi:hypothetical protein
MQFCILLGTVKLALADATFDRVYMYDQQFRLRKALNPTRPWSQGNFAFY